MAIQPPDFGVQKDINLHFGFYAAPMYLNRHVILQTLTRKPFGIHSPFLYAFAENCLYSREGHPDFSFLEQMRQRLKNDHAELEVTDYGQGLRFVNERKGEEPLRYRRSVSSIAKRSLQKPSMCWLLYRMARYFQPSTILELGTSLGLTSAYLAKARPEARIISLEGCPQTAARASALFRESGITNIEILTGPFSQTLPNALTMLGKPDLVYIDGDHSYEGVMSNFLQISEHLYEGSVLILDDIRWSKGMRKAWIEITGHPGATLSVDLLRLGIVFFNPALSKQIVPVGY
ncbi:MAG: class I SAM-dependent methyltransferase [Bacteroidales bacterium]|nr:class I SAM-dependent methyltransferase [Bacteroidales bacterium]